MSEPRPPLESVVILGSGQVAAIAAIALRRALPFCRVDVVGSPTAVSALADQAETALPFTNRLHDRLGIAEERLVREAGASHRLVVRYRAWAGPGQEATAPLVTGVPLALRGAFARHWGGGARDSGDTGPTASLAEALARAGRFAPPPDDPASPLADLDYALRWDGDAYRRLLAQDARQLGVAWRAATVAAVEPDGAGGIAALLLDNGERLAAQFYLDCSGPDAALLSRLGGAGWVDWRARLPVRRIAVARGQRPVLALEDRIALTGAGWVAETAGRTGRRAELGLPEGSDEAAPRALFGREPEADFALDPGRREATWMGNVAALGDATARFEPLGWLNLDLAHRQLDLLLELLPGRTPLAEERAEFNRRAALMADRACDFVQAHYAAPAAARFYAPGEPSDELARVMDQFVRRGRVPFQEETPIAAREWAGILRALGIAPGVSMTDRVEAPSAVAAAIAEQHRLQQAALGMVPGYDEWMAHMMRG